MAAGTVAYTDTRGNKDYLGMIASQIGKRVKQASNMAAEERAFAAKRAEEQGTSLEEAGIGKGYFFKRALGSRFGGDKIARTRGRLGAQGPGKDPSKNYKQRFRGGFDYNVTNEIQSATVPLSSALVGGLRGVENGLDNISQALATMGSGMSDLARGQNDLAKATYFNGMVLRVMVTEIKRQQSRIAGRREERSLESGRPRLSGGGGGTNISGLLPGAGGTGGMRSTGGAMDIVSSMTNQATRLGGSAAKAGQTGIRRAISSGTELVGNKVVSGVRSGTSAVVDFVPNVGKLAQASAKYLGTSAAAARNFFGKTLKAGSVGVTAANTEMKTFLQAQADMAAEGFGGLGKQSDNMYQMLRGYGSHMDETLAKVYAGYGDDADLYRILLEGGYEGSYVDDIIDVTTTPVGSSQADDIARALTPDQAKALAPARMAQLDNAGVKAAEMATDAIVKKGTKEGLKRGSGLARMMVKQFGAAGTKSILKKIPVVAGVAGILFGIQRAMEGDFLGAGLEITSGLLGATGVGAPLGMGIDGFLLARDFGMVPMAKGGLLTGKQPVNALMGEAGPEIVTPLNDETFIKFGQGFIDAQKRNRTDAAKIQAEGLKQYYEGMGGWNKFGKAFEGIFDNLKNIISSIRLPSFELPSLFPPGPGGPPRPGATAGSDTLDIGGGGGQMNLSDEQYKWLAYAISGEAGPGDDQYAVAASILNRVAEGRGTVEQVVKAHGQYEAYEKGMMKMSPEIEARLKSPEGQARMVAALNRLQGRTDFKGQTQLQNRVAAEDPMVDKKGNFFHYSWQTGANSVMPANYQMPNYQQFIKKENVSGTTPAAPPVAQVDYMKKWAQSMGVADKNATALNTASSNLSMLSGLNLSTPTIINNTNYYTQSGSGGGEDGNSLGSPFDMLSAFNAQYSLATK